MTDCWSVTPPLSPANKTHPSSTNFDDESSELFNVFNDWHVRMFNCEGDVSGHQITYSESSYLMKNDWTLFIEEETEFVLLNDFGYITLFGYQFDKGSALMLNCNHLFKMTKQCYMQLECNALDNMSAAGSTLYSKNSSHLECRANIVQFINYVRNYTRRLLVNSKYKWMSEEFITNIFSEINSFNALVGTLTCLPDYLLNCAASKSGNRNAQPSYHLFHCKLDIKWLSITVLYLLIKYKQRFKQNMGSQESSNELTFCHLESVIHNTIIDVMDLSFKRFQLISIQDLPMRSLFTCTCVRELWRLLQVCCAELQSQQKCRSFWELLNEICCDPFLKSQDANFVTKFSTSSSPLFCLWTLKHSAKLYKSFPNCKLESNSALLENSLKCILSADVPELQLRIILRLANDILNLDWEERAEPIIQFWEYFQKRLNSSFYLHCGPVSGLAIKNKSALGLINHLSFKLDDHSEKNLDSFHLYLKLLSIKLKIWMNDLNNIRCWKQLKGRILCKFSASKLCSLNETGLCHFISVFIVLAMSTDFQEMSTKLQMFLKMISIQDLTDIRLKNIWISHLALILISTERNQDISVLAQPLLDEVNAAVLQKGCLDILRVFVEGFQEIVEHTENLELGQYLLIGNWIPKFLSISEESDVSQFLTSILTLLNKLNSLMCTELPIRADSQLILLHNSLWENLIPYLKSCCSNSSCAVQVSDLAVSFTTLSLKSKLLRPSKAVDAVELFNFLITNDATDPRLLVRYLSQLCKSINLFSAFKNNQIMLIKGWIRCLLLLQRTDNNHILTLTNFVLTIPEIEQLFSDTSVRFSSTADYFETFLIVLQMKYSSLKDPHSRNKFVQQVTTYFKNSDRWISHEIKTSKSTDYVVNVYENVGLMFLKIPEIIHIRNMPGTLLKAFVEKLLFPIGRDAKATLSLEIFQALKSTLHLYVHGLFKLRDSDCDVYIDRTIGELITTYVPILMTSRGTNFFKNRSSYVSLVKCFEPSDCFNVMPQKILEILVNKFLHRKNRNPHEHSFQVLNFLHLILQQFSNNQKVIKIFIGTALESVCATVMFCDISHLQNEAKNIVHLIFNLDLLRDDHELGSLVLEVFKTLCDQHLAFTSRNVFDFMKNIVDVAPDLVLRFMPHFEEKIKDVELKRRTGCDHVLRKGLQGIQNALNSIKKSC